MIQHDFVQPFRNVFGDNLDSFDTMQIEAVQDQDASSLGTSDVVAGEAGDSPFGFGNLGFDGIVDDQFQFLPNLLPARNVGPPDGLIGGLGDPMDEDVMEVELGTAGDVLFGPVSVPGAQSDVAKVPLPDTRCVDVPTVAGTDSDSSSSGMDDSDGDYSPSEDDDGDNVGKSGETPTVRTRGMKAALQSVGLRDNINNKNAVEVTADELLRALGMELDEPVLVPFSELNNVDKHQLHEFVLKQVLTEFSSVNKSPLKQQVVNLRNVRNDENKAALECVLMPDAMLFCLQHLNDNPLLTMERHHVFFYMLALKRVRGQHRRNGDYIEMRVRKKIATASLELLHKLVREPKAFAETFKKNIKRNLIMYAATITSGVALRACGCFVDSGGSCWTSNDEWEGVALVSTVMNGNKWKSLMVLVYMFMLTREGETVRRQQFMRLLLQYRSVDVIHKTLVEKNSLRNDELDEYCSHFSTEVVLQKLDWGRASDNYISIPVNGRELHVQILLIMHHLAGELREEPSRKTARQLERSNNLPQLLPQLPLELPQQPGAGEGGADDTAVDSVENNRGNDSGESVNGNGSASLVDETSVSDASNIVVGDWKAFQKQFGTNSSEQNHPRTREQKIAVAGRIFNEMAVLEGMDSELDDTMKACFSLFVQKLLNNVKN